MRVFLTYYHDSGQISVSFHLYKSEKAFAFGIGESCNEAEEDLKGWFDKEHDLVKKRFRCDRSKPHISLMKKMSDDKIIRIKPCIDILKDFPFGRADQITVRNYDF